MQRDVWAHLRAFGVGFALSVLAGCGGGFSDPADKSDDADADLIDVQVTADLDSMGEQELESKLLALGFKRVQTYGVNGRSYWTLAALPGISRPDLEGLRRLGGLAAVVQHRGRADSTGAAAAASRLNSLPVVSRTTSLSVGAAGIGGSPRPNPTGPASTPSAAHAGITIKWVYEYTGSASGQVHGCRSNPDGSLKLFDTPQDAVDACHAYLASTGSGFRFLNFRPVGNGWTLQGACCHLKCPNALAKPGSPPPTPSFPPPGRRPIVIRTSKTMRHMP